MGDESSPFQDDHERSRYSEYQKQPESTHSVPTRPYETIENNLNVAPSFSNHVGSFQVSSPSYPAEAIINQINATSKCEITVQSQSADSQVRAAASALLSL